MKYNEHYLYHSREKFTFLLIRLKRLENTNLFRWTNFDIQFYFFYRSLVSLKVLLSPQIVVEPMYY